MRRSAVIVVVSSFIPLGGCTSALVGGGPGLDAGTLAVSGIEGGLGAQLEALGYSRPGGVGWGLGAAVEFAGYQTAGDADPIAFTTLEARWRQTQRRAREGGPYWELGSGAGLAWAPGIQAVAVPAQGEVGVQVRAGDIILAVGARERFLLLIGDGSPALDAFNSIQLVLRVGFGSFEPERPRGPTAR